MTTPKRGKAKGHICYFCCGDERSLCLHRVDTGCPAYGETMGHQFLFDRTCALCVVRKALAQDHQKGPGEAMSDPDPNSNRRDSVSVAWSGRIDRPPIPCRQCGQGQLFRIVGPGIPIAMSAFCGNGDCPEWLRERPAE